MSRPSESSDGLLMGKPPFLVLMQGMKKTGKSVLIKHICWQYRNVFQYIVVFSGSEQVNEAYGSFLPKQYIHSSYDSSVVNAIIEKQKKFKKAGKDVHCLIIWDDCMGAGFDHMDGMKMMNTLMHRVMKLFSRIWIMAPFDTPKRRPGRNSLRRRSTRPVRTARPSSK